MSFLLCLFFLHFSLFSISVLPIPYPPLLPSTFLSTSVPFLFYPLPLIFSLIIFFFPFLLFLITIFVYKVIDLSELPLWSIKKTHICSVKWKPWANLLLQCIVKVSKANCPVCLEDIHTSRIVSHVPSCGHLIHRPCFHSLIKAGFYACPTCGTSMMKMNDVSMLSTSFHIFFIIIFIVYELCAKYYFIF